MALYIELDRTPDKNKPIHPGHRIAALRTFYRVGLNELSQAVDYNSGYISQVELGRSKAGEKFFIDNAAFFGYNIIDLLNLPREQIEYLFEHPQLKINRPEPLHIFHLRPYIDQVKQQLNRHYAQSGLQFRNRKKPQLRLVVSNV